MLKPPQRGIRATVHGRNGRRIGDPQRRQDCRRIEIRIKRYHASGIAFPPMSETS
jgi:hypothetical protein